MFNSIFLMILAHGSEHHAEPAKAVVKVLNHDIVTLHPMLVHLPIGLLVAAIFFEFLFLLRSKSELRLISRATFFLGGACALMALASGFLADNELGHGYAGHDLAHTHRNWMIAGTVVWILVAGLMTKLKSTAEKLKIFHLLIYGVTAAVFFLERISAGSWYTIMASV
jgi:uncharacterized membrane protein